MENLVETIVSRRNQSARKPADGSRSVFNSVPAKKDGTCSWRRHFPEGSCPAEVYGAIRCLSESSKKRRFFHGDGWVAPGWESLWKMCKKSAFGEGTKRSKKINAARKKKSSEWRFGRRTIFLAFKHLVAKRLLTERDDHPRWPGRRAWLPSEHDGESEIRDGFCHWPRGADCTPIEADCTPLESDCTRESPDCTLLKPDCTADCTPTSENGS